MKTEPAHAPDSLTSRLGVFHKDYRGLMLGLLAIGAAMALLTFASLQLITAIVQAFLTSGGEIALPQGQPLHGIISWFRETAGFTAGLQVVVAVLASYVLVQVLSTLLRFVSIRVNAWLEIRSSNDMEQSILANLLRKDDKFFLSHSVAEIANRLNVDTQDMIERRQTVISLFTTVMGAASILYFLLRADWTYAVSALLFSLVGVFVMRFMLGEMEYLRNEQLQSEDDIKSIFEDYLAAAPEIQVGNLYPKVIRRLDSVQDRRMNAFMRTATLNGRLMSVYSINQLIAFVAILGAIAFSLFFGADAAVSGLVAAVVAAVPQLYGNISDIARVFMELKLAEVSERRLVEYQSDMPSGPPTAIAGAKAVAAPIGVDGIKYAFVSGEQLRGGPDGISLNIAPNSLNVIVGPAGSGKSTLAQLLMGRMEPVAGRITYGDTELTGMGPSERSGIFSYMPQSLMLIDGSIEENIRFGQPPTPDKPPGPLDAAAMGWVERTSVSVIARERALDMEPVGGDVGRFDQHVGDLRRALRSRVTHEAGIEVVPFGSAPMVPRLSVLENLTTCAADLDQVFIERDREMEGAMVRLADAPESHRVIDFGRSVIGETSNMLQRCPTYDTYAGVAPFPISRPVWEFRSQLIRQGPLDRPDPKMRGDLLLTGLTASPPEGAGPEVDALIQLLDGPGESELSQLMSRQFGRMLVPLREDELNPNLRWRDNLLFGMAMITNAKAAQEVNRIILDEVAGHGVDEPMMLSGLRYNVGRQGKRLSGGQRQLVCLCRTFIQGHPVILVDEPTAALDPKNRGAINQLLRDAAAERTVVAITHDVDLARLADQVLMMKDGRLWDTGTFDQLVERAPEFRHMINMREEAGL
ncbi:MAG: ATP-binding cassette domain-containing protein [Hyphomicrobiales bacterium]